MSERIQLTQYMNTCLNEFSYHNIWTHVWTNSVTHTYWLVRREIVVSFSDDEERHFSVFQSLYIGFGFRPVSTGCVFPWGKVAGALNWRLTSTLPVYLHRLHGELSLRISYTLSMLKEVVAFPRPVLFRTRIRSGSRLRPNLRFEFSEWLRSVTVDVIYL
jgi:hypothetical protein